MNKPRITYDVSCARYYCEYRQPPDDCLFEEWSTWWDSPVGEGDTPKEAFLDWYNQMVEQHIDE